MLAQANVLPQSALRLIQFKGRRSQLKVKTCRVYMIINTNPGAAMAAAFSASPQVLAKVTI